VVDDIRPASGHRGYGLEAQRKTRGSGSSPRKQASGEDDGVHEATQREIDTGSWTLKTTAALRPRLGWRRRERVDGVLGRERVWKRCAQGLDLGSYRLGRGERAAAGRGEMAINDHEAGGFKMAVKGKRGVI
jgi:hypothetical protein